MSSLIFFFFQNIIPITFFVLGSISASFVFCMGERLVENKSIFTRSHCLQCKNLLPFYTLIPIFSYLFLLGKCHSCKKNIGLRHPLSEIIYGFLFVLVWHKLGFVWDSAFFLFCWSLLFFTAFLDWQSQCVYSFFLVLVFLAQSLCLFFDTTMLLDAFLGLTVGAGFLYFINFFYQCLFSKKGIGSGDISLLGILGYFLGVDSLLPTLFYSSLGGLFIGLGFLIKYKKNVPFPFTPALVLGAFIHWYIPSLYLEIIELFR